MSDMPERTYLKMHAWALQVGTLTDTAYIRAELVAAKDAEIERLKASFKTILAQCVGEADADYILREHLEQEDEK